MKKELTVQYINSSLDEGDELIVSTRYGYDDEFACVGDIVTYVSYKDDLICVKNSKGTEKNFFAWRFDVNVNMKKRTDS